MKSLAEVRRRARRELHSNPTIEVYGWVDGAEFHRRPYYPLAAALGRVQDQFRQLGERFRELGAAAARIGPLR